MDTALRSVSSGLTARTTPAPRRAVEDPGGGLMDVVGEIEVVADGADEATDRRGRS
jgi:hypothetical protein